MKYRVSEPIHSRLEQVLVNLIHNAVKFTRPGGEVVLFAEPAEGAVQFAVKDTGIGIPADDLPRIFERFYRVDKSRAGSGTGLGLSIARHIVEAHGGKIWADSVEGQGSTFFFTIPQGLVKFSYRVAFFVNLFTKFRCRSLDILQAFVVLRDQSLTILFTKC